jgi:hypothetical protein
MRKKIFLGILSKARYTVRVNRKKELDMSLPIAQITVFKFSVADVKSEGDRHKILGYIDESGVPAVVHFYKKADQFKVEAGDCLSVVGKPVIHNSKSLCIYAEVLIVTSPDTLYQNHLIVAGTIAEPKARTNPKAPLKFGLCVDHYDRDKSEKMSYWFNINLWGVSLDSKRLVMLVKGNNLSVSGSLELSTYNDKPQFNVSTRDFAVLPKPAPKVTANPEYKASEDGVVPPAANWDEIPF